MSACSAEWNERLSAWFDGEAEPGEAEAVAQHVGACQACEATRAAFARLGGAMRALQGAPLSTDRVRAAVLGALALRRRTMARRLAIAAMLVLVAAGGVLARRPALGSALVAELELQHLKAFAHGRPCEFESSEPAAVTTWLSANVAMPVPVPQLPGATLLGARRCKLDGRPAVALVYRVEGRGLTVFVPSEGSSAGDAAAAFAGGSTRCTSGRLGERICAASRGARSALAVGDDQEALLLASAAVVDVP